MKQEFEIEEDNVEYAEAEPEEHNEEYIEQYQTDPTTQFDILSEVTRNANIEEETSLEPEHQDSPAGESTNSENHQMDIEYQDVETLIEEPSEEYLDEPAEEYLEENLEGIVANPEIG